SPYFLSPAHQPRKPLETIITLTSSAMSSLARLGLPTASPWTRAPSPRSSMCLPPASIIAARSLEAPDVTASFCIRGFEALRRGRTSDLVIQDRGKRRSGIAGCCRDVLYSHRKAHEPTVSLRLPPFDDFGY